MSASRSRSRWPPKFPRAGLIWARWPSLVTVEITLPWPRRGPFPRCWARSPLNLRLTAAQVASLLCLWRQSWGGRAAYLSPVPANRLRPVRLGGDSPWKGFFVRGDGSPPGSRPRRGRSQGLRKLDVFSWQLFLQQETVGKLLSPSVIFINDTLTELLVITAINSPRIIMPSVLIIYSIYSLAVRQICF